ncbi:MAG: hypothetical protein WC405_07130 [Syntrophales bacterium]
MKDLNKRVQKIEAVMNVGAIATGFGHLTDEELDALIHKNTEALSKELGITTEDVELAFMDAVIKSRTVNEAINRFDASVDKLKSQIS